MSLWTAVAAAADTGAILPRPERAMCYVLRRENGAGTNLHAEWGVLPIVRVRTDPSHVSQAGAFKAKMGAELSAELFSERGQHCQELY